MAKHKAVPGDSSDKSHYIGSVGWGLFPLPGERRRNRQAVAATERALRKVAENTQRNRRS